jgi:hypothetical protein
MAIKSPNLRKKDMTHSKEHQRLRKLADFLKTVPEAKFDIGDWATKGFNPGNPEASECGSVACAVGWACTIPEFQAEGLHMHNSTPIYAAEDGNAYQSWHAARIFFGLDYDESQQLFSGSYYPGGNAPPADVIKRIEDLLEVKVWADQK